MKTKPILVIIAIIACFLGVNSCCLRHVSKCKDLAADTIPHQLIVQFDSTYTNDSIRDILSTIQNQYPGITYDSCGCGLNIVMLEFPPDMGQEEVHKVAEDDLEHEGKFPNLMIVLDLVPSVILVDTVDSSSKEEGIVVAIIDGGINKKDKLLKNRLWVNPNYKTSCFKTDVNGYDFVTHTGFDIPIRMNAHGTEVSKRIVDNIGENVDVQLMDLKIFDEKGVGSLFNALCAIEYAKNNGAKLINMSWGYYKSNIGSNDSLLLEFLEKTQQTNITLFASAGNDNINTDSCLHFPSGFYAEEFQMENIISVAAIPKSGSRRLTIYSNYGYESVGIAAQGNFTMGEDPIKGTSFSTPLVTQQAAQIISNNPRITNKALVTCLEGHTRPVAGCKKIKKGKLIMEIPPCE